MGPDGDISRSIGTESARVSGRPIVLLEGRSDVAALRVLLARTGDPGRAELVDLGGVTNVRRVMREIGGARPVLGLCDAGEQDVVARAVGVAAADRAALAARGFHVCDRDLEDELIRGLSVRGCLEVLQATGARDRFATFAHQPAWRGRDVGEQLRRFIGTTSGRQEQFAAAAAQAVPIERVPPPLAALVADIDALGE